MRDGNYRERRWLSKGPMPPLLTSSFRCFMWTHVHSKFAVRCEYMARFMASERFEASRLGDPEARATRADNQPQDPVEPVDSSPADLVQSRRLNNLGGKR